MKRPTHPDNAAAATTPGPAAPLPTRVDLLAVTQWVTAAALRHGDDLPGHLMQRLGLERRRTAALLRQLVAAQWLARDGGPRRPRYRPGALRQVVMRYPLAGLHEDLPWRRDFAPCFDLPPRVRGLAQHAFAELLDNAVEHSGGSQVAVSMRQTPLQLQLLVSDDGVGLFRRIERALAIAEPALAMLELAKGKLSSAPGRHAGHGLHVTARLADVFDLSANGARFQRHDWPPRRWEAAPLHPRLAARPGTSVYVAIALDTPRTLDTVLRAASLDGDGYAFERTAVPLQLLQAGGGLLASRAEARRVTARLEQFRCAELDFGGVTDIGHGFADELMRVFRREQPGVDLVAVHTTPRVAAMLQSIVAG
jgi:hypothetical protein